MALRVKRLAELDDRAVLLPHGTEAVTRVDRVIGDRRVPQGSVGRVTKTFDGELDVTIRRTSARSATGSWRCVARGSVVAEAVDLARLRAVSPGQAFAGVEEAAGRAVVGEGCE